MSVSLANFDHSQSIESWTQWLSNYILTTSYQIVQDDKRPSSATISRVQEFTKIFVRHYWIKSFILCRTLRRIKASYRDCLGDDALCDITIRAALERVSLHLETDPSNGFAWADVLGPLACWAVPVTSLYIDPATEVWMKRELALRDWRAGLNAHATSCCEACLIRSFDVTYFKGTLPHPYPPPCLPVWAGARISPENHLLFGASGNHDLSVTGLRRLSFL